MLTEHQTDINNQIIKSIDDGNRFLVLAGSAGVGKTYLMDNIIKTLKKRLIRDEKIVCSAPTHKALSVLVQKVNSSPSFATIQSCLSVKRVIDKKTGTELYKSQINPQYPPLQKVKYLIVDESSMICDYLLDLIREHAAAQGTTVLFVGDEKQLNPVNRENSPVFHQEDAKYFELTQIIRQGAGNPIIDLSRDVGIIGTKDNMQQETILQEESGPKGYLYTSDTQKIISELANANGTDAIKYLAWTNAKVKKINNLVRLKIYGPNPKKIEEGETLVFNAPYDNFNNNDEIKVLKVEVKEREFEFINNKFGKASPKEGELALFAKYKLKYYNINPIKPVTWGSSSQPHNSDNIIVIHEDSERDLNAILKHLSTSAIKKTVDWVDFYRFKEQFADLNYNHALSVHKSQGSTFKLVVLDYQNINLNRNLAEKTRMFYTGVTRASDLLILYRN